MKVSSGSDWLADFLVGCAAYYLTSLPVLLGFMFAVSISHPTNVEEYPVSACFHFDAIHYLQIVRQGYTYDPERQSLVAFFPVYPLLSRWAGQITGLKPEESALLTVHAALLGSFVLMTRYVRIRWPESTAAQRGVVLAIFGLWPTGLFFRMPYAESLLLFVSLLLLYGMARRWPFTVLALLAGLGTAVRPVGLALSAAFVWHILIRSEDRLQDKLRRVLLLSPLASWGLLAYMSYQWLAFGTPLAFAQTQEHWYMCAPQERGWTAKLKSLVILEPIWNVYMPGSPRYWGDVRPSITPVLSLYFWNPILYLLAAVLLAWGGRKRWLTGSEIVLGGFLLVIPYVTRSFEMSMASHGRFAAVIVVNYLVLGRLLKQATGMGVAALCTALGLIIYTFTFLYTKNFPIF